MRIGSAADEEADKVKLRVVDAPQIPTAPIGPKRLLLTAGVLMAGVGAGLALVFLLVQLDTSFYSVQGLRDIGLPVLGGISMQMRSRRRVARGAGLAGFAAGLALLLVVFSGFATYPMWLQKVL